jgi:adenosylcobinamide kinase/adenosylcobinamide-phosphate guanylyltransferase
LAIGRCWRIDAMTAHELILGGAKSGKSRLASSRAADWLAADRSRCATLVVTAIAGDDEMIARIARHQADRAAHGPPLEVIEAPRELGRTLRDAARPQRMLIVDCLTLWITQCLMPPPSLPTGATDWRVEREDLFAALRTSVSPVVLVSNEIGLGVLPLGRETRRLIDELGLLHQDLARECARATLVVAGCELRIRGTP